MEDKVYIGPYKVFRLFKVSGKRKIIKKNLTRDEAKALTTSYPDSNTSMVCFDKQFTSSKYYK